MKASEVHTSTGQLEHNPRVQGICFGGALTKWRPARELITVNLILGSALHGSWAYQIKGGIN